MTGAGVQTGEEIMDVRAFSSVGVFMGGEAFSSKRVFIDMRAFSCGDVKDIYGCGGI